MERDFTLVIKTLCSNKKISLCSSTLFLKCIGSIRTKISQELGWNRLDFVILFQGKVVSNEVLLHTLLQEKSHTLQNEENSRVTTTLYQKEENPRVATPPRKLHQKESTTSILKEKKKNVIMDVHDDQPELTLYVLLHSKAKTPISLIFRDLSKEIHQDNFSTNILSLRAGLTVEELKSYLYDNELTLLPPQQQILLLKGKVLDNSYFLGEYYTVTHPTQAKLLLMSKPDHPPMIHFSIVLPGGGILSNIVMQEYNTLSEVKEYLLMNRAFPLLGTSYSFYHCMTRLRLKDHLTLSSLQVGEQTGSSLLYVVPHLPPMWINPACCSFPLSLIKDKDGQYMGILSSIDYFFPKPYPTHKNTQPPTQSTQFQQQLLLHQGKYADTTNTNLTKKTQSARKTLKFRGAHNSVKPLSSVKSSSLFTGLRRGFFSSSIDQGKTKTRTKQKSLSINKKNSSSSKSFSLSSSLDEFSSVQTQPNETLAAEMEYKLNLSEKQQLCHECNKRLRWGEVIVGKCRCGYLFCSSHAHPPGHACTFDYKHTAKKDLRKLNPQVSATKITRI